jgi:hypothetical protein
VRSASSRRGAASVFLFRAIAAAAAGANRGGEEGLRIACASNLFPPFSLLVVWNWLWGSVRCPSRLVPCFWFTQSRTRRPVGETGQAGPDPSPTRQLKRNCAKITKRNKVLIWKIGAPTTIFVNAKLVHEGYCCQTHHQRWDLLPLTPLKINIRTSTK